MWRTALRPRWLALLLLVLAVGAAFVELGLWQLNVARNTAHEEQAARVAAMPVANATDLLRPHEVMDADSVGRAVRATGTYDGAHQVLVVDRRLDGRPGRWVVTPLVVDGTGARLAVLRGFLPDGATPPAAPAGPVTVTGHLSPPESAPGRGDVTRTLAPGEMQNIDLASLVNTWGSPLYNAVVFADGETGSAAASTAALQRVPAPDIGDTGVSWRNLAYAAQWWIFAAFALYMWARMVADDHRAQQLIAAEAVRADDPPGVGPDPHDTPLEPTRRTP